jgi:hypothetical protein
MWNSRKAALLAAVAVVIGAPSAAHAQASGAPAPAMSTGVAQTRFANGNDWQKSSVDQKRAFLFGIANAISVAVGWDARHVPEGQTTFSRRAASGLSGVSLAEAVNRVDAWYAANPTRLDMPVVGVLWLDIAKPKLEGNK